MPNEKEPRKKKKSRHNFDYPLIEERLKLMGIFDFVEVVIMKRYGVMLAEIFGPTADRTDAQARARGFVYWQFLNRYGWSNHKIAKWFGIDYSGVRRAIQNEEDVHGKENRKGMKHVN